MALNGVNPTSKMRLTGLSGSGLDIESMVSQLMKVERLPLDKLSQKRQVSQWKQDSYRDITNSLRSFQSDFFDILKPASNMTSPSLYQKFLSASTNSDVVTATGSAGVTALTHTITVAGIASASNAKSTGTVSKPIGGTDIIPFNASDYNNSFTLTYNGVSKVITMKNGSYTDMNSVIGNGSDGLLKQKVKEAFSGVDVIANGNGIQFKSADPLNTSDVITVSSNSYSADNFLSALNVNSTGTGSAMTFPLSIPQGRKFTINIVEGAVSTQKEIEWAATSNYNDSGTLAADMQALVDGALGAGKVTVDGADGKLTFTKGAGVDSISLTNSMNNNKILGNLGFTSGDSNKLSLSDTMDKVKDKLSTGSITFNIPDPDYPLDPLKNQFKLSINGVDILVKKTDTLNTLMTQVNNSDAGVSMSYSSFTDTFSIISKQTGAGKITLDDNSSGFFTSTNLTMVNSGADASFTLDGLAATRATNSFSVDGVNYTLKSAGTEQTITLTRDPDAVFNSVKSFVDKYNEIIGSINTKLTDKYDRDYPPLTDDQKAAMKDEDIKKWEDKAKTGLLRNDSILNGIVSDMRKALYDPIDGVAGGLYSIGITTGTYDQKGKLVIDETKLKNAISSSPEKVMDAFSKESDQKYSPSLSGTDKATRYKENGIANRLSDILQDNIRTRGDINGKKGALLEKAGLPGDISEFRSVMFKEISDYDISIYDFSQRLIDKENSYYSKFTALESALSKMQSQSSWIAAQMGSGN